MKQKSKDPIAADRPNADNVIAIVNGKPIRQMFADAMARGAAAQGVRLDAEARRVLAERMVRNELLVQESLKRNLHKHPDVAMQAEMLHRDLLANVLVQIYLAEHPVDDAQIQEEYQRRTSKLAGHKEYSARHILVADEAAARRVAEQLDAGAAFERLVDDLSIDQGGSKNFGGSLGWISIDNSDEALVNSIAQLAVGAYTREPVRTRFGWHLLRLDAVRDIRIPPLSAVKERLRGSLQRQQADAFVRELRERAEVSWPRQEPIAQSA